MALELATGARRWIATKAARPEIEALGLQPLRKFTAEPAFAATDLEGARLIEDDIIATIEVEYYFTHIRLADYR